MKVLLSFEEKQMTLARAHNRDSVDSVPLSRNVIDRLSLSVLLDSVNKSFVRCR